MQLVAIATTPSLLQDNMHMHDQMDPELVSADLDSVQMANTHGGWRQCAPLHPRVC
jgi:aryl carrier-like protein